MTQRYEDDGTAPTDVLDCARECAAREFIHSEDIMGGRVRRRAGTMDPPPSTSCADEPRGEGAREDDADADDDEDGRSRSVEDSCIRMDCRVGTSTGGGHMRVHDSKTYLLRAR